VRAPSFTVVITSIMLLLSILYALTFSYMLHLSLEEEVFAHAGPRPRYAGPVHRHNAAEWVLIVGPAVAGWVGTGAAATALARRWHRARRAAPSTPSRPA
jgi:hypothetical protein